MKLDKLMNALRVKITPLKYEHFSELRRMSNCLTYMSDHDATELFVGHYREQYQFSKIRSRKIKLELDNWSKLLSLASALNRRRN